MKIDMVKVFYIVESLHVLRYLFLLDYGKVVYKKLFSIKIEKEGTVNVLADRHL